MDVATCKERKNPLTKTRRCLRHFCFLLRLLLFKERVSECSVKEPAKKMEKAEAEPPVDLWLPIACVLVRNYSESTAMARLFPSLESLHVRYYVLLGYPIEQTKERCAPLFAFCFPSC